MQEEISSKLREKLLKSYFSEHGILLCNANPDLPYLSSVGGDWNSIIALIESGDVFYSKFYKNRVTYLSRNFYAQIKPYKQRLDNVSSTSRTIFEFVRKNGLVNTAAIKNTLKLSGKSYTKSMNELNAELLVTVLERDQTMNDNWSSFYWGIYETWERLHPLTDITVDPETLKKLLIGQLSEKQIDSIIRRNHGH